MPPQCYIKPEPASEELDPEPEISFPGGLTATGC
jgi:hypothetical protein